MVLRLVKIFLLITLPLALSIQAQATDQLSERVILTISGSIGADNRQTSTTGNVDTCVSAKGHICNSVRFDLKMLEGIGMTTLVTETPWTDGLLSFEGVLARDVLSFVDAEGVEVLASSFDNYSVDIPIEDFFAHDVIIATRVNGKKMGVRDNGPLWIIYPWTDNSKLKRPHYFERSIWKLDSLIVVE